jgi:hypothetical protein
VDRHVREIVDVHREVIGVIDLTLFVEWGEAHQVALLVRGAARGDELGLLVAAQREDVGDLDVVVDRQPELLEVVGALGAPGGLAGRLDRGQEQGDQDGDDRDDHQ